MAAVAFEGATCTGHGSFPPRKSLEGSGDVFVGGKPAHRVGDAWAVHCPPKGSCHDGKLAQGSSTVFVNGKPLGRIGDQIDCGSVIAEGDQTVFAG